MPLTGLDYMQSTRALQSANMAESRKEDGQFVFSCKYVNG